MTVDEIRELINLAAETGIAELEVQRGENRVRIRRAAFAGTPEIVLPPTYATAPAAPSPGAAAFVRVGERVQPGKVLCIIESMKLMNEIEAETSGIIESRLVMNGQPVEYGAALFAVRTV